MTFIFQGFRGIVFILDMIVYSLVGSMYQIFMFLAGVTTDNGEPFNIVSDTFIELISKRIYAFLFLFMVFKISITALNYIANPDTLSNAEKGIKNLFKRILFTLALIILLPTVFSISKIIQNEIIVGNVIPSILSTSVTDVQNDGTTLIDTSEIGNIGNEVAFTLFESFFTPNCDIPTSKMCSESTKIKKDINENRKSGKDTEISAYLFSVGETEKEDGERYFIFNYSVLLSTAVGLFVVWVLLVFCFDLGIRMIKLAVLEVIHPIVVMSYLNPKSKYFSNWVKEYISTYMTIFIRLFIMFFIIFLISVIQLPENAHPAMYPFIVLSIFMAAKQIPEMIKKIFNITSKFSLNPLSRVSQAPIIGKPLQAAAVAGTLVAGKAISSGTKKIRNNAGALVKTATSFRGNVYDKNQDLDQTDIGMKDRFKGFKSGNYQTILGKQMDNLAENITEGITNASDAFKNTKFGSATIDTVNKSNVVASKAVGKEGVTTSSILNAIGETDPSSSIARRKAKTTAKREKLQKIIVGSYHDTLMEKNPELRVELKDKDGNSLFEGLEKDVALKLSTELKLKSVDDLDDLERLSSEQKAKLHDVLPEILEDFRTSISNKSRTMDREIDKRDSIKISDDAHSAYNVLTNNEITLEQALDSTYFSNLETQINSTTDVSLKQKLVQEKNAIEKFKLDYNTLSDNDKTGLSQRESYVQNINELEKEIKNIENQSDNMTTLSRNNTKSDKEISKIVQNKK